MTEQTQHRPRTGEAEAGSAPEPGPTDMVESSTPSDADPPPGPGDAHPASGEESDGVELGRIAWLVVVVTLIVGMIVLAVKGDYGYAIVTAAVALSAAINLI